MTSRRPADPVPARAVEYAGPGSGGYARATAPHNSSGSQHPALVAAPRSIQGIAEVVRYAAQRGLRVLPQATGHGAAGEVSDDTIIIDTAGLAGVSIDPAARTAQAGAGATWATVNAAAQRYGLLGLAGSAPDVGVSGYTFGGGVGWLARSDGMASAALRAVDYVDGRGTVRRAAEDASDPADRDALWAFRGGGGVGVAARLEFGLAQVEDLWAGYLLWPVEHLGAARAAAAAVPRRAARHAGRAPGARLAAGPGARVRAAGSARAGSARGRRHLGLRRRRTSRRDPPRPAGRRSRSRGGPLAGPGHPLPRGRHPERGRRTRFTAVADRTAQRGPRRGARHRRGDHRSRPVPAACGRAGRRARRARAARAGDRRRPARVGAGRPRPQRRVLRRGPPRRGRLPAARRPGTAGCDQDGTRPRRRHRRVQVPPG